MSRHAVRVSVIIPFLNPGSFLRDAVESVLAQDFRDFELILADDGSTEQESALARGMVERAAGRIRYVDHPGHENRGISATRNLGLRHARGRYVTFLDADDLWLPGKLTEQIGILDSHPEVPMLCAPARWWYSWTGNAVDAHRDFAQRWSVPVDCVVEPPALLRQSLADEWAVPHDVVLRAEAALSVGGWEESFRGMYEDQVFQAKMCISRPVYVSGTERYWYRQHANACTSQFHAAGAPGEARTRYLAWLESYLREPGRDRGGVLRTVRGELFRRRWPRVSRVIRVARRVASGGGLRSQA